MLGFDWLRDVDAHLSFGKPMLTIRGRQYKLQSKPFTGWVRRVVVQSDVSVPNRCEYDIEAKVEFSKLACKTNERGPMWMTEAKELRPGVYLPRTLVADRPTEVPVRLMNVSGEDIRLKAGSVISELYEATEVLAELPTDTEVVTDSSLKSVISDMISRVDPEVPDQTKSQLEKLMYDFGQVFSKGETDLGLTSVVMHRIDTGDAEPTRQQLRRQARPAMEAIDKLVPEMLKADLIEPSSSPWAANIVLVKKRDGTTRCCIDYRQLNAVTKKDRYPLPRTDACLDALNGSKWFSTFDLRSAYHQVMMNPADKEKTSFICHRGSWQFKRMPFGLCGAGPHSNASWMPF